ncbi:hypothetical protein V1478_003739 [Vespula squamosa]|uniref:Uncharacterized protein n=1 Tax=Vespula squamosa TaxID=30214 RepID=A0ABD2BMP0_VESSQ
MRNSFWISVAKKKKKNEKKNNKENQNGMQACSNKMRIKTHRRLLFKGDRTTESAEVETNRDRVRFSFTPGKSKVEESTQKMKKLVILLILVNVVIPFIQGQSFRLLPSTKKNVEWELKLLGDTVVESKKSIVSIVPKVVSGQGQTVHKTYKPKIVQKKIYSGIKLTTPQTQQKIYSHVYETPSNHQVVQLVQHPISSTVGPIFYKKEHVVPSVYKKEHSEHRRVYDHDIGSVYPTGVHTSDYVSNAPPQYYLPVY